MFVLRIIVIVLNAILFLCGAHFAIFGLFPLFKKRKVLEKKEENIRFLIVIAARNEEMVIGNLIDSIKGQNYPKDLYRICVVPNNCQDKTKEVSLEHGAEILEPTIPIKSKGDVLNFVFQKFEKDNSFDAYVIFDADNVLDPNYLSEINQELLNGYSVVQGFRDTKNIYDSCITGSYALFFYLQNLFLYESRTNLSSSANVNGTGYAFLKDVVKEIAYKPSTLTEDIEFTTNCAIHGVKIGYAKKAIFYDEQVNDFLTSFKQRRRWVQGTLQVLKKQGKDLFRALMEKNPLHKIDVLFVLIAPITQFFSFFVIILSFVCTNIFISLLFLVGTYLANFFMGIFLTIYYKKNIKKMLPSILYFAIFNLTWMPICIYSLFKTNTNWEEIKHTKKVSISDLLKQD